MEDAIFPVELARVQPDPVPPDPPVAEPVNPADRNVRVQSYQCPVPGCFNSQNTMTGVGFHINSTHQATLFIPPKNDASWKFIHDSGRWPCFACDKSWSYCTAHCTRCHAQQIPLPARPAAPADIIVGEVEDRNVLCERYLQKCVDLPHKLIKHIPKHLRKKLGESLLKAVKDAENLNTMESSCRLLAIAKCTLNQRLLGQLELLGQSVVSQISQAKRINAHQTAWNAGPDAGIGIIDETRTGGHGK
jgi:hypothetical protein